MYTINKEGRTKQGETHPSLMVASFNQVVLSRVSPGLRPPTHWTMSSCSSLLMDLSSSEKSDRENWKQVGKQHLGSKELYYGSGWRWMAPERKTRIDPNDIVD